VEKKAIKYLGILFVIISSCSVNKDPDGSTDFDEEKNVYFKKIGRYHFSLKPYSSDRLAAINYPGGSGETRDSIIKDYNDFICFVFEIDIDGFSESITDYDEPGKESDYDEKVNYYLFGMQNDLKLADNKGFETPCTIYYHERTNEISKSNRFIAGFRRPKTEDLIFEYNNPYLNCGKVNISINKQHLALK
jgi:hypothetical protein